jgi:Questin oxidase-like
MKNKTYQRPPGGSLPAIIEGLSDPETFKKYMRDNSHYSEFIVFFRNEIESKGYEAVVNRWLFEGNELANAMLERFMICEHSGSE